MISLEDGIQAVKAARGAAAAETEGRVPDIPAPASFESMRTGVFVTINEYPSGILRGCIGYPVPPHDLARTLILAARGVCYDPRFPPLKASQVGRCTFEVTVLTEPEPIEYKDLAELKSKIVIGTDGLIAKLVRNNGMTQSALFLPQVPVEQEWDIDDYLDNICMKAGLQRDAWRSGSLEFEKFQGVCFGEKEPCGDIVRL